MFDFISDVLNDWMMVVSTVNKQINDKERVAAAMENPNLREIVEQCVAEPDDWWMCVCVCVRTLNRTAGVCCQGDARL